MYKSKKEIMKRIQEHLNIVISHGYSEERILGIFLYGSQNYGLDTDDSDIDTKVILLPSFEDVCLNKKPVSVEIDAGRDEHIEVKDIRLMREMYMKQNINFVETLFTEYRIVNDEYADLFDKYFLNNREKIARYNERKTLVSVGHQLIHTIKQNPTDTEKLSKGYKLYHFLINYKEGMDYEVCLKPQERAKADIINLKLGRTFMYTRTVESMYEDLLKHAEMLLKEAEGLPEVCDEEALAALNEGTIEILKYSFGDYLAPAALTKKEFFQELTNAESRAYYSIIKEIGAEGNITISKLVERNSISRPVYNNLINKLKEFKVANVVNMGMKGTYIKILHPELKAEAIDF